LKPHIDPAIWQLCPDFMALSIRVQGVRNRDSDDASKASLAASCLVRPDWAEAHLAAWQDAYRAFGAKPNRTPCSAEALRKRALRGGSLPAINAVVDLYNATSVAFTVPVGGEDLETYRGVPRLLRASGQESFVTVKEGEPANEAPEVGEVVWADDEGVTCRRWNWRQGSRTRVTLGSHDIWFVIERLAPMPVSALKEAGATLIDGLRAMTPGIRVDSILITPHGSAA
jgi:DNA/RNA-binding domain of Phe-tRNA-synthetase-like protein